MSEKLARQFHEIYERLAPSFGYETRKETREFDSESANGKLMIAVTDEIERLRKSRIAELETENKQLDRHVDSLLGALAELERLRWRDSATDGLPELDQDALLFIPDDNVVLYGYFYNFEGGNSVPPDIRFFTYDDGEVSYITKRRVRYYWTYFPLNERSEEDE